MSKLVIAEKPMLARDIARAEQPTNHVKGVR